MQTSPSSSPRLASKSILVTGANQGIGFEFVKQLSSPSLNNTVIATVRDISNPSSYTNLSDLAASNNSIQIKQLDLSNEISIESFASSISSLKLGAVINNAGVVGTSGYTKWSLSETTSDEMLFCFKINTIGPLLLIKNLMELKIMGNPSLIANLSSKVGSVDDNSSGRGYAYRASKSALNIVTKSLAVDLKDKGVVVTWLHPGWVKTRMTEYQGLISAEESVNGMLNVLETKSDEELSTTWFDYKSERIPW